MRLPLLIISLLLPLASFAQQLTFHGELVDSIRISSNISVYLFDEKGTTKGKYHEYLLRYDLGAANYVLDRYHKVQYKITYKPDTVVTKTKARAKNKTIDQSLVSDLLKAFETDVPLSTFATSGISEAEFLELTDRKKIMDVGKEYFDDGRWQLSHLEVEEELLFFEGCRSVDTLNLFLNESTSNYQEMYITDFDDHLEFEVFTKNGIYKFERNYPNEYTQPWLMVTGNINTSKRTLLNLKINRALVNLLPKSFSRIESLELDALGTKYIRWYLRRRDMMEN